MKGGYFSKRTVVKFTIIASPFLVNFVPATTTKISLLSMKTSKKKEVEQFQENALTSATKHKETIVHERFRQKLSSSGIKIQTKKKEAKKRTDKKELM